MMQTRTPTEPLRGRPAPAWALDVAVTVGVLLTSVASVLSARSLPWWARAVPVVALAVPLLFRRIRPVAMFATMYLVAAACGWWLPEAALSVGFLVALYTVASRCPRRPTFACAGVLTVGVIFWSGWVYSRENGWQAVAVTLVMIVAATTSFGLYISTRRTLLLELQQRAVQLEHERDQQGELAAAAERARIAREMHDVVAHHLTVMVALADGAAAQASRDPDQAGDAMRTVSSTGREALTDTRRLLGVLRDPDPTSAARSPLPGLADLDDLVAGVRAAGLPVRYEIEGRPAPLDAGVQLALYRLVQEALTNTMKHAGPGASAQVRIVHRGSDVCVKIVDDGRPDPVAPPGTGRGLAGMRERVAAVGGEVSAGRSDGPGWTVRCRLPHAAAEPQIEPRVAP